MKKKIDIGQVLDALGDPTRRAILERLSERPHSVSGLATPLGVTLTAIGQHLQVLESSGLVTSEKIGRVRTCRIEPKVMMTAEDWIASQRASWEARLDRLDHYLKELQAKGKKRARKR